MVTQHTYACAHACTHTRTRTHTLLTVYALHVAALYTRGAPVNFLTQFLTKGINLSCVCLLLIRSCYPRTNATVLFMCSVSCVVATMQQSGTYAPALYNVYNRGLQTALGGFAVALAVNAWLGVGSMLQTTRTSSALPTTIDGCPINSTVHYTANTSGSMSTPDINGR